MMEKIIYHLKKSITYIVILIFVLGFTAPSIMQFFVPNVVVMQIGSEPLRITKPVTFEVKPKVEDTVLFNQDIFIEKVLKKDGAIFEEGDKLFKLSSASVESLGIDGKALQLEKMNNDLASLHNQLQTADQTAGLKNQIQEAKDALTQTKALADQGAASAQAVVKAEATLASLQLSLTQQERALTGKVNQLTASIDLLEKEIALLKNDMVEEENHFKAADFVDETGYFLAPYDGVMVTSPKKMSDYGQADPVAEIVQIAGYEDSVLEGLVHVSALPYLKTQTLIKDLRFDRSAVEYTAKVTEIGSVGKNDHVNVTAQFVDPPRGIPKVYSSVSGSVEIEKRMNDQIPTHSLPLSAFVKNKPLQNEDIANIYGVRVSRSLLGVHQSAVKMKVQVITVGDQEAEFKFIDDMASSQIILNPSYEIQDNTRIYCESLLDWLER